MTVFGSKKNVRRLRLGLFICIFVVITYLIYIPTVTKKLFFDQPNKMSALTEEDKIIVDQMQQFLYNEFQPGSCFGQPSVDEVEPMTAKRKIKFEKMKRNGDYIFSFSDGRCCQSTQYEIKIWKETDHFEYKIIDQDSSSSPC